MGNAGSTPGSDGAAAAAARLSAAVFGLLADKSGKERLLAIGSACRCDRIGASSTTTDGFSSSSPAFAAIIKTVCLNDPALDIHVKTLPPAAAESFWRAYFAVVAKAFAEKASPAAHAGSATAVNPESAARTLSTAVVLADDEEDELLLLQVDETFVYKLGPRPRADGYTADSWGLDSPLLTALTRVVAHGERLVSVSLWERPKVGSSGATLPASAAAAARRVSTAPAASGHRLVAVCEIPLHTATAKPGSAASTATAAAHGFGLLAMPLSHYLEPVLDSSRYYALRVSQAGRSAVIGIGFRDRQTSFDLRSAVEEQLRLVARQRGLFPTALDTSLPAAAAGGAGSASGAAACEESSRLAALIGDASLSGPPSGERLTLDISHIKLKGAGAGSAAPGAAASAGSAAGTGALRLRLAPPRSYVAPSSSPATARAAPAAATDPSAQEGSSTTKDAGVVASAGDHGGAERADDDNEEAWGDFAAANTGPPTIPGAATTAPAAGAPPEAALMSTTGCVEGKTE